MVVGYPACRGGCEKESHPYSEVCRKEATGDWLLIICSHLGLASVLSDGIEENEQRETLGSVPKCCRGCPPNKGTRCSDSMQVYSWSSHLL